MFHFFRLIVGGAAVGGGVGLFTWIADRARSQEDFNS